MKTIAIHPNSWRDFCEAFSQLNKGTLMTVEFVALDNRRDELARDALFQKMTFDTTDDCNNVISLSFDGEDKRRSNHVIVEPIHLRWKEGETGQKFLQIEAESGVTLVTFHSGKFPQMAFDSEFGDKRKRPEAKTERSVSIPS